MVNQRRLLSPLALLALIAAAPAHATVTDGLASYYGARFHGRLTASGERFNMHNMTAAHRTLKFGTRVMVTNKANGKTVEVTINDRGPYIKGRSIDLSKGAARELGMIGTGVARVELAIVKAGNPPKAKNEKITLAQAERIMRDLF